MFANLDAGNAGGNRFEFASDFRGRIHLEVEDVLVRGAAREENHDDRLVRAADARLRFGLEKLGQGQATQSECADLEKIPARDSVAEPLFGAVDC